MNIQELRQRVNLTEDILKTDMSKVSKDSRPGRLGQMNAAKQSIEGLKDQLAKMILGNSFLIKMSDKIAEDRVNSFVEYLSAAEPSTVSLDQLGLENIVLDEQFKAGVTVGYPIGRTLGDMINLLMRRISLIIGVVAMPNVEIPANKQGMVKTKAEILSVIKLSMKNSYQNLFHETFLNFRLVELAKSKLDYDQMCIVLKNVEESNVNEFNLMVRNGVVVTTNPDSVGSVVIDDNTTNEDMLKGILNLLASKKNN